MLVFDVSPDETFEYESVVHASQLNVIDLAVPAGLVSVYKSFSCF